MINNDEFHDRLQNRFNDYKPNILQQRDRCAAVLVPFIRQPESAILLTTRAAHLSSHPGQVSFPGGMSESQDLTLVQTALRETFEEVALPAERFEIVGELSTACSKDGVLVYPVVAVIDDVSGAIGNPEEIANIFSVPWRFFKTASPEFQRVNRHGLSFNVPHFYYQGHHIWGLTAMIILEALNVIENTQYELPDYTLA